MDQIYFADSTKGFYTDAIHGENKPADCVPITKAVHDRVMAGAPGMQIGACPVDGCRLVPIEYTPDEITAAVDAARQAAYTAEADPLFFKAQRGEATMDAWQAKVAEIKARFPEGVMPGQA